MAAGQEFSPRQGYFIAVLGCFCLTVLGFGCREPVDTPSLARPNILLILVDDMGYSDIGCYGGEIPTPHLDALATEGLRMTNFYNAARCCPTRASLLTGLYPHQAGMGHQNRDRGHPAYRGRITPNATTLAEALGLAGYRTYHVGKWHVGNARAYWPDRKGFQAYLALIEGAMNYYDRRPWLAGQDSLVMTYNGRPYQPPEGFYATQAFSDTAAAFLRRHDFSSPFFMYLAYNAPHWPLHAPQATIQRYTGKFMMGWDSLRAGRLRRMKQLGLLKAELPLSPRFPQVPAWNSLSPQEKKDWDLKMALYAAVMHHLDEGVGTVVEALQARGQLDNTLIVFLSDNGACHEDPVPAEAPWVAHPLDGPPGSARSFPSYGVPWANASNTPFRYFKSFVHEGGIATPLMVRYPPAVPAGAVNHRTLGHVMDLMPTLLDAAGATYPERIGERAITPTSGLSLWPAWQGMAQAGHEHLFWEHQHNRAVRHQNWKLVSVYRPLAGEKVPERWELYDLARDPIEDHDLAGEEPERVRELARQYAVWAEEMQVLPPE